MNANDQFTAIMALDLAPIKVKLMHVRSGEGWSVDKANAVEREYRRFLCLMKIFPDESIAPLEDVDTFWHYHILDTMKYAADCEQAFGYFLHHFPYVGLRGEDDEQVRTESAERMRVLYEAIFGDAYPGACADAQAFCAGPAAAFCAGPAAAFCAGPAAATDILMRPAATTAFCDGPAARTAFCAGPAARIEAYPDDGSVGRAAHAALRI